MDWPRKRIEPLVGAYSPARMLKNVVLPAPLGPMRLTIDFSSMLKSTLLTAMSPPKRLTIFRATSSSATWLGSDSADGAFPKCLFAELFDFLGGIAVKLARALTVGEDAFGPRQHQDHQRHAEDPVL